MSFNGWLSKEETGALLNKTDVFILPSYAEGMPMAILEAMSYSIPVISTNVGGIPEVVLNNETGYIIKPGDLEELYKKTEELILNADKRVLFGENGRKIIETKHNINNYIKSLCGIYDAI